MTWKIADIPHLGELVCYILHALKGAQAQSGDDQYKHHLDNVTIR